MIMMASLFILIKPHLHAILKDRVAMQARAIPFDGETCSYKLVLKLRNPLLF